LGLDFCLYFVGEDGLLFFCNVIILSDALFSGVLKSLTSLASEIIDTLGYICFFTRLLVDLVDLGVCALKLETVKFTITSCVFSSSND